MLQESLNNYFIIASIAVGAFSILLIWIYLWETAHGIYIIDFITYKKYINCPFAFCTLWRSQMRFRAVALRSITAARF